MLVESKMCTFTLESKHFIFNKRPINTNVDATASAKFSTIKHETDYSVRGLVPLHLLLELFCSCRHHPPRPPLIRRHHLEIMWSSPHIINSSCAIILFISSLLSFHNLRVFLSVFSPPSTIRSHGDLKGLSHEMDLAFDDIYG
jgi:hypothetical protein